MNKNGASFDSVPRSAPLEAKINKLAGQRGELFDRSGERFGLSQEDQARLHAIERQLDECFLERRRVRAERDAGRFNPYARLVRDTRGAGMA